VASVEMVKIKCAKKKPPGDQGGFALGEILNGAVFSAA
jgi:hypothetical protein